jgi:hypothetical protein
MSQGTFLQMPAQCIDGPYTPPDRDRRSEFQANLRRFPSLPVLQVGDSTPAVHVCQFLASELVVLDNVDHGTECRDTG